MLGRREQTTELADLEACSLDRVVGDPWPTWTGHASAAVVITLAFLTVFHHDTGPSAGLIAVLVAGMAPWVLRDIGLLEVHTGAVVAGVLGSLAVVNIGGEALGWYSNAEGAQLSLMIGTWFVGETAADQPRRVAVPVFVGMLAIPAVRDLTQAGFHEAVVWIIGVSFAFVIGSMMRALVVSYARLHLAQRQLADEAAAGERARIAREVHDVVAHTLSVTMLHLTAARMAVRRSPAAAEEALAEAERLGRQSLADIRRTVGLLRSGADEGATDVPLPGLADIEELVHQYRSAGLEVDLDLAVDPSARVGELSSAQGLAAYRAVQEGLANVAKHAPGARAAVTVDASAGSLTVRVTDSGSVSAGDNGEREADGEGLGLRGMRERFEQMGGSLVAGPSGRGWAVEAVLPVAPAPAPPVVPTGGRSAS